MLRALWDRELTSYALFAAGIIVGVGLAIVIDSLRRKKKPR